jgi:hypothetical protein
MESSQAPAGAQEATIGGEHGVGISATSAEVNAHRVDSTAYEHPTAGGTHQ